MNCRSRVSETRSRRRTTTGEATRWWAAAIPEFAPEPEIWARTSIQLANSAMVQRKPDFAGRGVHQVKGNQPGGLSPVLRVDDKMRDRTGGRLTSPQGPSRQLGGPPDLPP